MNSHARQNLWWLVVVVVIVVAGGWFFLTRPQTTKPKGTTVAPTAAAANVSGTAVAASSRSPAPQLQAEPTVIAPVVDDGTVAVPSQFQLPGVTRVHTGSSFADWQSQFPADTQKLMAGFSKRYFGVYKVSSPAQVAWMAAHGYPMPEDLAAAQGMSDQNLLDLAKQGNVKAAFLLRGRNIQQIMDKISQYRASGKTSEDFWMNDPLAQTIVQTRRVLDPAIGASDSAFKGFQHAADAPTAPASPLAIEAQVIAGLNFASRLGDTRITWLLGNYVGNDLQRKTILAGVSAANVDFTNLLSNVGPDAGCQKLFPTTSMPYNDAPPH